MSVRAELCGAVLGGHLAHVLVFGAFGFSVLVALVWPTGPRPAADGARASAPGESRFGWDRALVQAAFLGLCAAAAVHLAVMPTHFRESVVLGLFFSGAAAAQVSMAVVVLVRPTRRVLVAVAVGAAAVVALWIVSRTTTLPFGLDGSSPEPVGPLDVLASAAELVSACACTAVLAGRSRARLMAARLPAWRWSTWSLPLRVALLAVGIGVPWAAALAPRG